MLNIQELEIKMGRQGTSHVVQWLRLHLPMQGVQVRSPVRELRTDMPHGQKKNIKQKQYSNKFNKDSKKMMGRQDLYIKFMQIYSLCYVRNASGIGVQGRE